MCDCVRLATCLWSSWVGLSGGGVALGHGVVRRDPVQWVIGLSVSSVSFSIVFLVSISGMISTLGAE